MKAANPRTLRGICLAAILMAGLSLGLAARLQTASASTDRSTEAGAPRQLTFEDRVAHQRAIEEVYWKGRLWPAENGDPRPQFETIMSTFELETKVSDYLRKSQALETYWERPVTADQLQAEIDRMVAETKRPAMLRELFDALGNDPLVIAECLARPVLVERLIRNWYSSDERFHGQLRQHAENQLATHPTASQLTQTDGKYAEAQWVRQEAEAVAPRRAGTAREISLTGAAWERRVALVDRIPLQGVSELHEDESRYYIVAPLERDRNRLKVAVVEWSKQPFEQWWASVAAQTEMTEQITGNEYRLRSLSAAPSCTDDTWRTTSGRDLPAPRSSHTAVWTGTEMIVWGGSDSGTPFDTGGRYNPSTNSWIPTSVTGAPEGRESPTGVWTGSEMIVWGGYRNSNRVNSGGKYNPATNTWTATTTTGAPAARDVHTAVWTGSEMIIWGGSTVSGRTNTGGKYNPSTGVWTATSITAAASARDRHTAVWSGTEMIVWGGADTSNSRVNSGGRYNPTSNNWTAVTITGAPTGRDSHSAVWAGSVMIIFGGNDINGLVNTGARYSPASDTWTATTTTGAVARRHHSAVWTGTQMIVWGGSITGGDTNTGARYNPSTNAWLTTGVTNAPTARSRHAAVWTGTEMIVWGGDDSLGDTDSGGRYNPTTNTWVATALSSFPAARDRHTAVWTGTEMIIWGGSGAGGRLNSGARYNPATDSWLSTSLSGVPSGRTSHSAVWAGSVMVVWGGTDTSGRTNTGGRYNPATNSWASTSTTGITAHTAHTAVWTGSEMIIWGGFDIAAAVNTGGRYNPSTDIWTATSLTGAPSARQGNAAVWTGSVMVIWGGNEADGNLTNTGARYDPVANSWNPTTLSDAPSGRRDPTSVWTGTELIVWGGHDTGLTNTGGRYNPATDAWTATSTTAAPAARDGHIGVWTGSEMIVWGGGVGNGQEVNTGGRYDPLTNTWKATTLAGAPVAREDFAAVAAGNQMIVWGGYGDSPLNTGGVYCAGTATSNTPPTIVGSTISRQKGGTAVTMQIATVTDAEQACSSLSVSAANISGSGITLSGISINAACQVTAAVSASCTAVNATFSLSVTDAQGSSAVGTLTVNVIDNTAPGLGTYPATGPINVGGSATVSPSVPLSDNGSVVSAIATAPGFSGTLSVNTTTGAVAITSAGPAGSYTVSVTVTDNCGAQTVRSFSLAIAAGGCTVAVGPVNLKQPYAGVPFVDLLTANLPSRPGMFTYSVVEGALPPGLKLAGQLGLTTIAGVPTTPGKYRFTLRALRNGTNCEGTRKYEVIVPQTVIPILECVVRNEDGSYTARFGYENWLGVPLAIPVGSSNYFGPGSQDRGQTTFFLPGRVRNAFSVNFTVGSGNLAVWLLRGPDGVLRTVNILAVSTNCL